MRSLLLSFQFLTIIPIRISGEITQKDLARSVALFPIVGAFQGLVAVAMASYLVRQFTAEVSSVLILLAWVLMNGGFHLDGLADTFDALAVKSTGDEDLDREKRLAVMKDSSSGAAGVIAIVFTVLLKFLFLSFVISHAAPPVYHMVLVLLPVFSKWGMVLSLACAVSARQDGLGKLLVDSVGKGTFAVSSLLVVLFFLSVYSCCIERVFKAQNIMLLFLLFVTLFLFSLLSVWFFRQKFGGLTGDNFGAIHEISEILILFMVIQWLQRFIY